MGGRGERGGGERKVPDAIEVRGAGTVGKVNPVKKCTPVLRPAHFKSHVETDEGRGEEEWVEGSRRR